MKRVFADTLYWVAISNPHDQWHQLALMARNALGSCLIITSDAVLEEYLTLFAGLGAFARNHAVATVENLLKNPSVYVVPHSRELFLQGIELYKNREDKAYSLTDCISMNIMSEQGIIEVLTNDHHFTQEGYTLLIHR